MAAHLLRFAVQQQVHWLHSLAGEFLKSRKTRRRPHLVASIQAELAARVLLLAVQLQVHWLRSLVDAFLKLRKIRLHLHSAVLTQVVPAAICSAQAKCLQQAHRVP